MEYLSLENNQLFSAGFGLALMGVGLRVARNVSQVLLTLGKRRFLVSLEVTNNDPAFRWVLNFVQTSNGFKANHVTVNTLKTSDKKSFLLTPSPGTHYMMYKNRFFYVKRVRENTQMNINTGVPFESVKFMTFGRDKEILNDILNDSQEKAKNIYGNKTAVFKSKSYMWEQFGHPKPKRPLESVILQEGLAEEILKDLDQFLSAGDWYRDKGIPYRRTYLFHGTPGSGKTSFIAALAGYLNKNISFMNLAENISDDQLDQAMSCVPNDSVIVMEDIDCIFSGRKIDPDGFRHGISFSGLLNVLDGVCSGEERIVFLTTNHLEKLDPALIRPGRVDVIKYFGTASKDQARKIFEKFFPGEDLFAVEFAQKVQSESMADLQGHLLLNKSSARLAVDNFQK